MDMSDRTDYIEHKIAETEKLIDKCTNDKKYFSLLGQLEFLQGEQTQGDKAADIKTPQHLNQ